MGLRNVTVVSSLSKEYLQLGFPKAGRDGPSPHKILLARDSEFLPWVDLTCLRYLSPTVQVNQSNFP